MNKKKTKHHCGECAYFECDGFPYCVLKDMYTEVKESDKACRDFVEY